MLVLAVATVIAAVVLNKTVLGRYTYSIGSNEEATALSGINVRRWKIIIYTLAGLFTGLAGRDDLGAPGSAQPGTGLGYELQAIAAVVIGGTSLAGGKGSIVGTIIGALIISVLNNGLQIMSIPQEWQNVILGVVILVAVYADMARKRTSDTSSQGESAASRTVVRRSRRSSPRRSRWRVGGVRLRRRAYDGGSSPRGGGGGGEQPYIAIVSKGFQHQFWQAVKQGAEQEAKAEGARITFEGPPTEQDIEQQVTMLTNAIQKKPAAIGFAALDSQGQRAADGPGQGAEHPGRSRSTPASRATSRSPPPRRTTRRPPRRPPSTCPS